MSAIELWPAIDLLDGKPARLYQGAYDQVRSYAEDHRTLLHQLRDLGSPRLHLVDLTGARHGQFEAWEVLSEAVHLGFQVEVGGGFRSIDAISRALTAGARYVVLGTSLVADHDFSMARSVLTRYGPESIVVSIDVRDSQARIHGWTQPGPPALELWQQLRTLGYTHANVTDIQQDGSLSGIRPDFWQRWADVGGVISAGGGIRSQADLDHLAHLGIARAVVGKAWLEGVIDLRSMPWGDR